VPKQIPLDGYLLDAPTHYRLWLVLRQFFNRSLTLARGVFAALLIFIVFFWVRYSGVAHFDHYIWPTWVVILCIILPVLV
jgi:hypothetical protein